jgi:hypothetical protein
MSGVAIAIVSSGMCRRLDSWPDRQIRTRVGVKDWNIPVEIYKAVNFLRNSARRKPKLLEPSRPRRSESIVF